MNVSGTSIAVTGAASGLGEATARHLHAQGARVTVLDRDEAGGGRVAGELGIGFLPCDVTSTESVQAAFAAIPDVRGVVHCAGTGIARKTLGRDGTAHDQAAFRMVVEVNLVGSFTVLSEAAAAFARQEPGVDGERGAVVLTSSIAGFEGQMGQVAYGASKAGIHGMTLIAARDLADVGVRVNTIAPGSMGTAIMRSASPEVLDGITRTIPFPKRLGHPEEFAALAEHLLTNTYLNGTVVRLDAGTRFHAR